MESMFKKVTIILLIICLVLIVSYKFNYENNKNTDSSNPPISKVETPSLDDHSANLSTNDKYFNIEAYISDIVALAQEGMIMELSIIAGMTNYEEVVGLYGEPVRIDETTVGDYAIYHNPDVTIGYQDNLVVDLRSYAAELQEVFYHDLLIQLGDADEIRYYQDQDYDHIILSYNVNDDFQLKWILDNPNDDQPNPHVHHISVVALNLSNPNQKLPTDEKEISQFIQNLSLDEKIGQMIFAGVSGTEINIEAENLINRYHVGGIIFNGFNLVSPSQTTKYMNDIKQINYQNNIPLFFGIDQEGGRIAKLPGELTELPTNMEIGKRNDPAFSYEIGRLVGSLVKAYGFNINFAPVLDVNSNPNNPVIGDRSFSNQYDIVSELGIQTMKGIQVENIIPTIKHFPGHGDTSVDSHFALPTVNKSLAELEQLELIPFRRAIEAGADMVMIAHLSLPKIDPDFPSSLSHEVITELLRNQIGFDGVVITDDLTMEAITDHYDIGHAAVTSVQAGSDIIMVAHEYENMEKIFIELQLAVENGELSEDRINESVMRILKLKRKYDLKDTLIEEVHIDELNSQIESVLNR